MTKFLTIVFFCLPVWASLESTTRQTGSISSGLGGAGRAAVAPGDVSTLNPAMLAHLQGYYLYSKYLPGETAYSISDNTIESALPASVYYYQNAQEKNFKLSFAEKFTRNVSLGFSGSFFQYKRGDEFISRSNLDLGLSFVPKGNLGFGLVVYNLLGPAGNEYIRESTAPLIGFGSHFIYKGFLRFRADFVTGNNYKISDGQFMVGLENYLNRWMTLRIGYQDNMGDIRDLATAGFGFDLPKFKINYAYLAETGSDANIRHSVDLSIPF